MISPNGWIESVLLGYFGIIDIVYAVIFLGGLLKIFYRRHEFSEAFSGSALPLHAMPEISFILPVYNEQRDIISVIDCLLDLSYRNKQIIIVNDGSQDDTWELMQQRLQLTPIPQCFKFALPSKSIKGMYRSRLHPECLVIDKENGTRFDALNAGLNVCQSPYFLTIDADTFIDDESLKTILQPIFTIPAPIAIGAIVRIRDIDQLSKEKFLKKTLPLIQSVEYIRTSFMRLGLEHAGGNFALSGAFSCFHTATVVKAGGFAPTFAHDLEIILRLHRVMQAANKPYQIIYLPDPSAWTYALTSLKALGFQRTMWHRGLLESMWFHKSLFFNRKYGAFGLFVYPLMFFGEVLAPLLEILGYLYLILGVVFGTINPSFMIIEEIGFKKSSSVKKIVAFYGYSLMENLGFRQLTLIWKACGVISFFKRFSEIQKNSRRINEQACNKTTGFDSASD